MTITRQQVDAWNDEVDDAYKRGLHDGIKQERALWTLSKLGQEIEAQPEERNFCPRCGKRLGLGGIHTCTPPKIDPNAWAFDRGLEST